MGKTLTADPSPIQDDDGISNAVFTYQWVRQELGATTGTDIAGETKPTYTVTDEDVEKPLTVRVTFTDDAGNKESRTNSNPRAFAPLQVIPDDETPSDDETQNRPATGVPTIGGTVQVGETLTADTSSIADADGLTGATFTYQWLADDVEITDATGSTHTLAAEEGKAIRVRVSFTDNADNDETLTSDPTAAVLAAPQAALALSDFNAGTGQRVLASALIVAGDRGRKDGNAQDQAGTPRTPTTGTPRGRCEAAR